MDATDQLEDAAPAVTAAAQPHAPGRRSAHRRVSVELAVVVVLLAAVTASRWVVVPHIAVMPAVQALGYAAIVPAAAIVVYAASTRRRWTAMAAGVLVVVHVVLAAPWWVPAHRGPVAAAEPLVVLASNLQYGRGDAETVVAAVRDHDVDVAVLLEATADARAALAAAGLDRLLPHEVGRVRDDAGGALVRSRHPLHTDAVPPMAPITFEAPVVRVATPGGDVLLMAAHPVPPWPGDTDRWRREIAVMADWTARAPGDMPVVVAGDLNATTDHPELRRLAAPGLVNAHRAAGGGRPATWPRPSPWSSLPLPPLLHLDHVLVRDMTVVDAGTVDIPGSDHSAVWARLAHD